MNICTNCQTRNPSRASFCQACGAKLATTQTGNTTVTLGQVTREDLVRGEDLSVTQPLPNIDPAMIASRALQAFGATATIVRTHTMNIEQTNQREHLVILVDVSGSMNERLEDDKVKLEGAIQGGVNLGLQKHQIDPHDHLAVVAFDFNAMVVLDMCHIGENKRRIIQALQSLSVCGGTDIDAGLKGARNVFDWSVDGVVRRVVLLTDGHNMSNSDPLKTANALKERGVVFDVVGIGQSPNDVDEPLLKSIASKIDGQLAYRFIRDSQTLCQHYTQLGNKTSLGI